MTTNNKYEYPVFDYVRSVEQDAPQTVRRPVVIVGAGPIGVSAAIDLSLQGIPSVVLDDDNTVSIGSRAICYAKRALEIWDRLGCAKPLIDKGVTWQVGKVFHRNDLAYTFDLLPESDHKTPAFINLQQYHLEETLVNRANACDDVEIRWKNKVVNVEQHDDYVTVTIDTPDGQYTLECDYLIAADGVCSQVRRILGLDFIGQVFEDRFLIADVIMKADFPAERWFWFDPPFHSGQSVLLHKQADDVWRIDFQLGWDADPEVEKQPERVIPRIKAMLGEEHEFDLEWVSVYTFQCRRLEKFRHGRILFAGDAAHQVSPFGARGANSGVQDTDNLAWKLKLVIEGNAPDSLLDSYSDERVFAADENLMNSTRSTEFITPKGTISKAYRSAVLEMAKTEEGTTRPLVNSGRLSLPATLSDSYLNNVDKGDFQGLMVAGAPCTDAPINGDGWLLDTLGNRFIGLYFADSLADVESSLFTSLSTTAIPVTPYVIVPQGQGGELAGVTVIEDSKGLARERYDAQAGTYYLIRPDQHVAARFRQFNAQAVSEALAVTTCNTVSTEIPPVENTTPVGHLHRTAQIKNPDDFYEKLIDSFHDLDEQQAQIVNAKLTLLLANHIGDSQVLEEALALASASE